MRLSVVNILDGIMTILLWVLLDIVIIFFRDHYWQGSPENDRNRAVAVSELIGLKDAGVVLCRFHRQ